jgi:MraZ protein
MLLGQYNSTISKKRRVAVPKKFRDELGNKFIVARWYEGCLVAISLENWTKLLSQLTGSQIIITAPVRDTDRFILGSAYEVEPDEQGRIVLPENLTKYAKFESEVTFLGLGNRIELWNKVEWQARENYIAENAGQLVEELAKGKTSNAE